MKFKVERWEADEYVIFGPGGPVGGTYHRREAEQIVGFLNGSDCQKLFRQSIVPRKIKIVKHYPKHGVGGDYIGVTLEVDDFRVAKYGDYYHDKGGEKAKSAVKTLKLLGLVNEVEEEDREEADEDACEIADHPNTSTLKDVFKL